jgi:hypothetical protein
MEISFSRNLTDDTRLFKKVIQDVTTRRIALVIKLYIHVLPKSARIIITIGFRVSKSFKYWIRLKKFVFNFFNISSMISHFGNIMEYLFGGFSLSRARFTYNIIISLLLLFMQQNWCIERKNYNFILMHYFRCYFKFAYRKLICIVPCFHFSEL